MQGVQDPSQNDVDNLNNVRREGSRHFRNKKMEYLEANRGVKKTDVYCSPNIIWETQSRRMRWAGM